MSEQLDIFLPNDNDVSLYFIIEPDLLLVLDRNMIAHHHLSLRKRKEGNSVVFRNTVIFQYKFGKQKNWLKFPANLVKKPFDFDFEYEIKNGIVKISFSRPNDVFMLRPLFSEVLDVAIDSFPKEFDCCSRYLQCSDAKQCVNPDKELAMDCRYKTNLKNGLIFYGKNAVQKQAAK